MNKSKYYKYEYDELLFVKYSLNNSFTPYLHYSKTTKIYSYYFKKVEFLKNQTSI